MREAFVVALVIINMVMVILSNAFFKVSALSTGWRDFLSWQVAGNLAGLGSVLTLTALFRYIPLSLAYTFNAGLTFVFVQVLVASFIFHERISTVQWVGTGFVTVGVVLISLGR